MSDLDLCSLEDVLAFAPGYTEGDEPETDVALGMLIGEQSRDFSEYTHRQLAKGDPGEERTFELGSWECDQRRLLIDDAAQITAITLTDEAGTTLQALDPTAWVTRPRVRQEWEPIVELTFPRYIPLVAWLRPCTLAVITATWGFPAIPVTASKAVARLVLYRYLADVANQGTQFADAAMANGAANPAASRANALDVRDRFRRRLYG